MQRLRLLGTFLLTGSCLVIGTIAAAEPVSNETAAKKHAACEGSKVKTSCNKQADVLDFVKGRQAPSPSGPTAGGNQTAVSNSQQDMQRAKEDGAGAQPPQ
jgi:hypothetical protein